MTVATHSPKSEAAAAIRPLLDELGEAAHA